MKWLPLLLLSTLTVMAAPPPIIHGPWSTNTDGTPITSASPITNNAPVTVNGSLGPNGEGFSTQGRFSTTNVFNGAVNVLDFGANPDAISDSRSAIQAALNSLPVGHLPTINTNTVSGTIYIPAGLYKVSGPITIPCGVRVIGAGKDATVITNTSLSATTFLWGTQTNTWNNFADIEDLSLTADLNCMSGALITAVNGIGLSQPWITLKNVWTWGGFNSVLISNLVVGTVENCKFSFSSNSAFVSRGTLNVLNIKGGYAWQPGGHGFDIQSASASTFLNCAAELCGGDGIHLGDTDTNASPRTTAAVSIIGGDLESNLGNAIFATSPQGLTVIGTYSGQNHGDGIHIEGGRAVTIIGYVSQAEHGYSLGIYTNLAEPLTTGVSLIRPGDMGGILGRCNHQEIIEDSPQFFGSTQVHRFGSGLTGIVADYGRGTVIAGANDTMPADDVFGGFIANGDNARLRLQSGSDPTNYWTEFRNAYSSARPFTLQIGGGNSNGLPALSYSANGNASNGVVVMLLPIGNLGGPNGSIGIGFTNSLAALAVNGGLAVGSYDFDPGFGNTSTLRTNSSAYNVVTNNQTVLGTNFVNKSSITNATIPNIAGNVLLAAPSAAFNAIQNLLIQTTDSEGADLGGGVGFGGSYTGTTGTQWAAIAGRKDNGVDGQFGGYLSLATRPIGGANQERLRITSAGVIQNANGSFSADQSGSLTLASSLTLNSQTASTLLQTDGSKHVVSVSNGTGILANDGTGALSWVPGTAITITNLVSGVITQRMMYSSSGTLTNVTAIAY